MFLLHCQIETDFAVKLAEKFDAPIPITALKYNIDPTSNPLSILKSVTADSCFTV